MKRLPLCLLVLLACCSSAIAAEQSSPQTAIPMSQPLAMLTASDGQAGSSLGSSVAASGSDTVFALGGNATGSAIYVYQKPSGGWQNMTQTAELGFPQSNAIVGAIAAQGDTVVATAGNLGKFGLIYVYVKPAGGWINTSTPTAVLEPTVGDQGYFRIAIGGNTIVAGETGCLGNGDFSGGEAVVFQKPAGGWQNMTQTAVLAASDAQPCDNFADSVAVSGNTVVIGADRGGENPPSLPGKVYVYEEPQTGWTTATETAELSSSANFPANLLGGTVAAGSNVVFTTGIYQHAFNIFVFEKPANGWVNATQNVLLAGARNGLLAADPDANLVVDGAAYGGNQSGTVQFYSQGTNGWQNQSAPIYSVTGAPGARLGAGVGAGTNLTPAGAIGTMVNGNLNQGAVYVFGR